MKKNANERKEVESLLSSMNKSVDSFVDSYDGSDTLKKEMRRRIKKYLAACIEDKSDVDVTPSAISRKLGTSESDALKTSRYLRRYLDSVSQGRKNDENVEASDCMFGVLCELVSSIIESCNAIVSYVSAHGCMEHDGADDADGKKRRKKNARTRSRRKSVK